MTSTDLLSLGVTFTRGKRGRISIQGPRGDAELLATVRQEVSRRLPFVLTQRLAVGYGKCDCCGDEMEHYKGGDCWLCAYARQKAIDEKRMKEAA